MIFNQLNTKSLDEFKGDFRSTDSPIVPLLEQQIINSLRLLVINLLHMQNISVEHCEQRVPGNTPVQLDVQILLQRCSHFGEERGASLIHLRARSSYSHPLSLRISNASLYFWDKGR